MPAYQLAELTLHCLTRAADIPVTLCDVTQKRVRPANRANLSVDQCCRTT
jgi:hypothetical protein